MVTAVVCVGPAAVPELGKPGRPDPLRWVQTARRAATKDLLSQLAAQPLLDRLIVLSPEVADLEAGADLQAAAGFRVGLDFEHILTGPGPIHVGRALAETVDRFDIQRLLYFGGGSAPLLDEQTLNQVIEKLAASEEGVFTNNLFASDWAGVTPAAAVARWQARLPKDNMLGWVLSSEAGLPAESLPASAGARLDIDTPGDLLTLALHPGTKRHLRAALDEMSLDTGRLEGALAVLATPASHVFIAGRLAPEAWSALNAVTRCWIRVISEERGMVSSGRLARGEVSSLLGQLIDQLGLEAFFDSLAGQAGAALIDNRVLMAHHGRWPSEADRFASDLGLVDQVEDPWLREFTARTIAAPMPIVLGGHGLLSGDLYALCDLLSSGASSK